MSYIYYRAYIKGKLISQSPFITRAVENLSYDDVDMVVLRDSSNKPYIPGSSIAGVLRNEFPDNEYVSLLFGDAKKDDKGVTRSHQSNLITYDCFLSKGCIETYSVRDGIRLNEYSKTTETGAKYDYEVVDAGVSFDFKAEFVVWDNQKNDYEKKRRLLDAIIKKMTTGIYIGAKVNRGFGLFILDKLDKQPEICEISGDNAYADYVNFDWEKSEFEDYKYEFETEGIETKKIYEAYIPIKFPATILIRQYIGKDVKTLTNKKQDENKKFVPIIPGTSWAGLFRHRCKEILLELQCDKADEIIEEMFGSKPDTEAEHTDKKSSKVGFSETEISGNIMFKQTNVKIDRFTQGAVDGALYDETVSAKGHTKLLFRYREEWMKDLLCLALEDLRDGLIAIGGQTSIGRGLCKPDIVDSDYTALYEKIKEVRQ